MNNIYVLVNKNGEFFFGKFKHDFDLQIRSHGLKSDNQFYPYILIPNSNSLDMWKSLFVKYGSSVDSCLLASLLIAYKESIKILYINKCIGGEDNGLLERIQKSELDNHYIIPWNSILLYL